MSHFVLEINLTSHFRHLTWNYKTSCREYYLKILSSLIQLVIISFSQIMTSAKTKIIATKTNWTINHMLYLSNWLWHFHIFWLSNIVAIIQQHCTMFWYMFYHFKVKLLENDLFSALLTSEFAFSAGAIWFTSNWDEMQ